jgi:SPX domain protein involved in polyphosphate accumulation
MSNLSHTIRKFNRFELKYLISLREAERFKTALRAYLLDDEHGNGRYALTSLYYDSPDLRCYWEKVDGIKFRRKLRIRRYETESPLTADVPVFVEIKQRLDRVTQKRRIVLPYQDALLLCNDRQIPEKYNPVDKPVIEEIYAFLWNYNLRPANIVRYERQALIGTDYDIGLRVTFDTSLTFQNQQLLLHEKPISLPMFPVDTVVMEIKVNERIPYWLTELVAAHNLKMIRVSKYCRGVELAENMPSTFSRFALSSV